jgi:hypothetical protein
MAHMTRGRSTRSRKRIAALKRQIRAVAGPVAFGCRACPPEIEERFLEQVLAFETAVPMPLFDRLVHTGVRLPSPDDLPDQDLHAKLWEVIRALALLGAYLHCTNHLSDRALYSHLWREALREPMILLPHEPAFSMHLDVVGSGSEEDIAIYLRYYADENMRQSWAKDFPDLVVPPHEEPPYDRDRLLPQCDWEDEPGNA